ncbi:MAG: outer membrane beta-barrel protein [Bacteroidales bacterium]|nr:outer membrane beta-barrel protein [Bacteroidales bacterium]
MNRFYLLLIFIVFVFSRQAFAQVKFGIKAGGNLSTIKFDIDKSYGTAYVSKFKGGFHVGIITDISLLENTLSLQPALLYSKKGCSIDYEKTMEEFFKYYGLNLDVSNYKGYFVINYNYIEVPINFVYKKSGFQILAGPYFVIGLSGSSKQDFSYEVFGKEYDSEDFFDKKSYTLKPVFGKFEYDELEMYLDKFNTDGLFRAFDFGINFGVGYQLNKVLFNVNYSLGLVNCVPKFTDETIPVIDIRKNRVLNFSVSYFFN